MKYTIYDAETGAIVQSGSCSADQIHNVTPNDPKLAVAIGVAADSKTQKIDVPTKAAVARPPDQADLVQALRIERDRRLAACDWTQFADCPLTDKKKQAWAAYRQALRNLPATTADPEHPVWPPIPE